MESILQSTAQQMLPQMDARGCDLVANEVHHDLGKLEEKAKGLTERQREYVAKYLLLASASKVAAFAGVRTDTVSESILSSARRMGFKNAVEMYMYATSIEHSHAKKVFGPSADQLETLYREQAGQCSLSGVTLTQHNMVLDHRIPKSKGGEHSIDNLQWLCDKVNTAKGTLSQEDFLKMCCRVASYSCGYRKPKQASQSYERELF
jgi:hypothetical protein